MTRSTAQPTVRAKICGVRTLEAARAAVQGGADYLGFAFYAPSKRAITPTAARAIVQALRGEGVTCAMAGFFVDAASGEIEATAALVGLDIVQLSGNEQPEALRDMSRPILKTVHLAPDADVAALLAALDAYLAAARHLPAWPHGERLTFLLDTAVPGHYGGTGRTADWSLAAHLAAVHPCGLAGGLTPDNVAAAIAQVRPWLVDVSSGVETEGVKDPAKIGAFLAAASTAVTPSAAYRE